MYLGSAAAGLNVATLKQLLPRIYLAHNGPCIICRDFSNNNSSPMVCSSSALCGDDFAGQTPWIEWANITTVIKKKHEQQLAKETRSLKTKTPGGRILCPIL